MYTIYLTPSCFAAFRQCHHLPLGTIMNSFEIFGECLSIPILGKCAHNWVLVEMFSDPGTNDWGAIEEDAADIFKKVLIILHHFRLLSAC